MPNVVSVYEVMILPHENEYLSPTPAYTEQRNSIWLFTFC
jgi:hypothetical protein